MSDNTRALYNLSEDEILVILDSLRVRVVSEMGKPWADKHASSALVKISEQITEHNRAVSELMGEAFPDMHKAAQGLMSLRLADDAGCHP